MPDPTANVVAFALGTVMSRTTTLGTAVTFVTLTTKPVIGGMDWLGAVHLTVAVALPAVAWPIVGAAGKPKFTVVSVNLSRSTLRTMSTPSVPALSVIWTNARLPD